MPEYGKGTSSRVAANIRHTFPAIELAMVVGICGGMPYTKANEEIFLGDVIISESIVAYDEGCQLPNEFILLNKEGYKLGADLERFLKTIRISLLEKRTVEFLREPAAAEFGIDPDPKPRYLGSGEDKSFKSTFRHKHHREGECEICDKCKGDTDDACPESRKRDCEEFGCYGEESRSRLGKTEEPHIYLGRVASGDTVLKSGIHRDDYHHKLDVIAFEMEGAGVFRNLPCLIIKGVCDYADSHKNKNWQDYAAATAAACLKAVLREWRPTRAVVQASHESFQRL
ncbi:nucleoside phosphorylase domain-containing protein [Camillea tinctor]|nr:nucleoside phosphorylase domain-containing protein [Camillea tinctor]